MSSACAGTVTERPPLASGALDLDGAVGDAVGALPGGGPWWRRRRSILTATAGAGVLVLGISQHGLLTRSAHSVTAARPAWALLAVGAEAVSMVAFAVVRLRLLRGAGVRMAIGPVTALALAGNAISATVPFAGSELGIVYAYRQFQRRGADAASAAWVLAISGVASSVTFWMIVAGTAIVAGNTAATLGGVLLASLLAAGVGLGLVALHRRTFRDRVQRMATRLATSIQRMLRRPTDSIDVSVAALAGRIEALRLRPRLLGVVVLGSGVNWLADIACAGLAVIAVGGTLSWPTLLLAWAAAATASSLQLTPGGLGVAEATMIAALVVSGMPAGTATAAVLIYRLISYWMLVLIGAAILAVQRLHPPDAVGR